MIVTLHTQGLQAFEQIRAYVEDSQALDFEITDRRAAYAFVTDTLLRFGYGCSNPL